MTNNNESKKNSSLMWQVTVTIVLITTVTTSLFTWYEYLKVRDSLHSELEKKVSQVTIRLGRNLEIPVFNINTPVIEHLIKSEMVDLDVDAIIVLSSADEQIYSFKHKGEEVIKDSISSFPKGTPWVVQDSITYMDEFIGFVIVQGTDTHLKKTLKSIVSTSIFVTVILNCILSLFVSLVIKKIFIKPVENLTASATEIAQGNLDVDIVYSGSNEISVLSKSFQQMKDNLKEKIVDLRHINEHLEDRVKERTVQLEKSRKIAVENAHKAGQAEVAISVLHNIGNLLNTAVTSSQILHDYLRKDNNILLRKANNMLRKNIDDIPRFVNNDPKGKKLFQFYLDLEEKMDEKNQYFIRQTERLLESIDSMKKVVTAQQSFASAPSMREKFNLKEIVQETVLMLEDKMAQFSIALEFTGADDCLVLVDKTKVIQIVMNLCNNAIEAINEAQSDIRFISIDIARNSSQWKMSISDTGNGIAEENLQRVFNHGFTTKEHGHGFGLHSCANYMTEMKGSMEAQNRTDGQRGAVFVSYFPIVK